MICLLTLMARCGRAKMYRNSFHSIKDVRSRFACQVSIKTIMIVSKGGKRGGTAGHKKGIFQIKERCPRQAKNTVCEVF